MSIHVSYKKQTIFFIILIFITLIIAEGLVRNLNPFNIHSCSFVSHEIFKKLTNFEKEEMCNEYSGIKYDESGVIILLQPNQHGKYVNINSEGFRGEEINFNHDDYRIFFLGGSTAFGFVSSTDDYTIPGLLEKKLKDAKLNVTVINAGIPGAASTNERYYIEKYIINYSPDMIIMYDGLNDSGSYQYDYTYEEFKNQSYYDKYDIDDLPMIQKGTGMIGFFKKIDYQTGLGVARALHDLLYTKNEKPEEPTLEDRLKAENKLQSNWSKICEMGQENNFQTINILQPILGTGDRILSNSENFSTRTTDINLFKLELNDKQYQPCDKVYDLRNVFDGMNGIPIYFDQGHMSDFGNEIIASEIYEKILPLVLEDTIK